MSWHESIHYGDGIFEHSLMISVQKLIKFHAHIYTHVHKKIKKYTLLFPTKGILSWYIVFGGSFIFQQELILVNIFTLFTENLTIFDSFIIK